MCKMEYGNSMSDLMNFSKDLLDRINGDKMPIFLCVGSDKFVCDSVAPIVAEIIRNEYNIQAFVYGGLTYNINATNLMEAVNYIDTVHPNSHIVLIDVTLGENVGNVIISEGSFAGMGKCLPIKKIGATSILAVVARPVARLDLNSVRLKNVVKMARFIAKGCYLAVSRLKRDNFDKNRNILTSNNY